MNPSIELASSDLDSVAKVPVVLLVTDQPPESGDWRPTFTPEGASGPLWVLAQPAQALINQPGTQLIYQIEGAAGFDASRLRCEALMPNLEGSEPLNSVYPVWLYPQRIALWIGLDQEQLQAETIEFSIGFRLDGRDGERGQLLYVDPPAVCEPT